MQNPIEKEVNKIFENLAEINKPGVYMSELGYYILLDQYGMFSIILNIDFALYEMNVKKCGWIIDINFDQNHAIIGAFRRNSNKPLLEPIEIYAFLKLFNVSFNKMKYENRHLVKTN